MRFFVNTFEHLGGKTYPNPVLSFSKEGARRLTPSKLVQETVEIEAPDNLRPTAVANLSPAQLRERFPLPSFGGGGGTGSAGAINLGSAGSINLGVAGDAVTVGDLNSSARGTGARKSSGKPDWSQLPMWAVNDVLNAARTMDEDVMENEGLWYVVDRLALWQRGDDKALLDAAAVLAAVITRQKDHKSSVRISALLRSFLHTVRVLEFGAKKYAKGNWAKGMSWSVCYTCAISHLTKFLDRDVTDPAAENDEESGISHLAHAMCNLLFLIGYKTLFPEGDDRLKEFRPEGVLHVDLTHD